MPQGLGRRAFLSGASAAGVGVALSSGVLSACSSTADHAAGRSADSSASAQQAEQVVPFRGDHQAGIVTPVQDRLVFATFDVTTDNATALGAMLARWTATAEALTAGELVPGGFSSPNEPTADTGEAYGLGPANLTVTIGYGPGLFDDRFGLRTHKPAALAPLPRFPRDDLRVAISGGDICLQACADDPLIAYNAIHNLAREGVGVVTIRTMQVGFGRTASTSTSQATARNLMGFKDGTRNLKVEEHALVNRWLWSSGTRQSPWMEGGSYLIARKIRMLVERWDRESLQTQEATFGRAKDTGAPLGATSEFDTPNFAAHHQGTPVIADAAHIRLASPEANDGTHILRRGYNYTDGVDPRQGTLDSGLFFIAYAATPANFTRIQNALATDDQLNEYIRHISSAVFACPRGLSANQTWADQLFSS